MECQICAENLSAYLDSELSPAEVSQVKSHLQGCGACKQEYESLLFSQRALESNFEELELHPATWRRIERQIRGEYPQRARAWGWLFARPLGAPLAGVATAVLAILIAVSALMLMRPDPDTLVRQSLEQYVEQVEAAERSHGDLFAATDGYFEHNPFAEQLRAKEERNPFKEDS